MEMCARKGCKHKAEYVPKVFLPSKGFSMELEASQNGILGLKLCKKHVDEVKVTDFGNFQALLSHLAPGAHIDWDRVYFTPVAIKSEEYKAWEKS